MTRPLRTLGERLDPGHTAVCVIDVQNDFCSPEGAMAQRLGVDTRHVRAALPAVNRLIAGARAAGVPVVYVRVEHDALFMREPKRLLRADGGEVWPVARGSWGAAWVADLLPPEPQDVVLTKHNYDAFADTPLQLHLDARAVRTLVFAGFQTEVCVETTARRAFVLGYHVVLPRECTQTYDQEAYHASLRTLGRYFGSVVGLDEVLERW